MTEPNEISTGIADAWTGIWHWNADTARFSDPHHGQIWKKQYQQIKSGNGKLSIRCFQLFSDGSRRSWTWDGRLDGKPRQILWDDDGSAHATISFTLLTEDIGGIAYVTAGGDFCGAENFVLSSDKFSIWGCTTAAGAQYPYFEEWDRVPETDVSRQAEFRAFIEA